MTATCNTQNAHLEMSGSVTKFPQAKMYGNNEMADIVRASQAGRMDNVEGQ